MEVRCEFFKNKRSYLVLLVCSKVYDTLCLKEVGFVLFCLVFNVVGNESQRPENEL